MPASTKVAVSLPQDLFAQLESAAQQFQVSRSQVVASALAQFFAQGAAPMLGEAQTPPPIAPQRQLIHQGDVYWVPLAEPDGITSAHTHPHVVIQDDALNHSRLNTVVVCALTTNRKRAKAPGNVPLEAGEANLPKPSVVVVSQVATVDKTQLGEYLGTLTPERVQQILAGLRFVQRFTQSPGV